MVWRDESPLSDLSLFGAYRIVRRLGPGGTSTVFEAEFQADGMEPQSYALKPLALPDDDADSEERRLRFRREMLIGLSVRHNNVCRVVDWGFQEDVPFIVMELLNGCTLEDYVQMQAPLSVDQSRSILVQMLQGLGAIHAAGVVHRNLTPRNVFICSDGVVKIMDFGLARKEGQTSITATGTRLGTPSYLSPEQLRDTKRVDHVSDLFNVGVMTYVMLTRRHPFASNSISEVVKNVLQTDPPPLQTHRPDLPATVDGWVRRLIAKDKTARFQSARAALEALTF